MRRYRRTRHKNLFTWLPCLMAPPTEKNGTEALMCAMST